MSKKRTFLLLVAVVALAALGGGGFFAYQTFSHTTPEVEEPPEPEAPPKVSMGPVHPLDPFLVNLSDPGLPLFLKVVVHLELDSEAVSTELQTLKPKVRDAMLTQLSSKTSAELSTVADKERLRNEMIHRLNAFLTAGKVVEVYFIEFVVQ
jgi:flagellar FliL protein